MFAIVMCLVLLICTLTIWNYVLCVLMVECMSVVVNVMVSLTSVMSLPPALCYLSVRTVVKLCTFGVFALWVSLVSRNVVISACVLWISSLSSSSLFLIPLMLTWSINLPVDFLSFFCFMHLYICLCFLCIVICMHSFQSAHIFKVCNSVMWPTHPIFTYGHIVKLYSHFVCSPLNPNFN